MGIVSIVLAGLGGSVLGFIFGLFGYLGSRRGEATNGKLALWGAILNVAVPTLIFGGIILYSELTTP